VPANARGGGPSADEQGGLNEKVGPPADFFIGCPRADPPQTGSGPDRWELLKRKSPARGLIDHVCFIAAACCSPKWRKPAALRFWMAWRPRLAVGPISTRPARRIDSGLARVSHSESSQGPARSFSLGRHATSRKVLIRGTGARRPADAGWLGPPWTTATTGGGQTGHFFKRGSASYTETLGTLEEPS